jgi:membrane-bound lytic murein transglycosylase MltF
MTMHHTQWAAVFVAIALAACGSAESEAEVDERPSLAAVTQQDPASPPGRREAQAAQPDETPVNPSTGELLPMPFAAIWQPWTGDYAGMVERRVIRVLVPYGGYQFYYDEGLPRGAVYELVQRFEAFVNEQLGRRNIKVYVVVIPVSREELLPALRDGHADFVAADLTITAERAAEFDFSRPLLKGVNEVVVTGPGASALSSLDALAGQEIVVRKSSSYHEHLQRLSSSLRARDLQPVNIVFVDELFEAEDILETMNAGMFAATVMDDYKAEFWSDVFPNIVVRNDLIINEGGSIAWATRKDSPELMKTINKFLRKYGKGTLIGNDTFNRYLKDAARVRCAHSGQSTARIQEIATILRRYAEQYDFDWLMLAAQGFQESGLRQDRRSPAGAVGIMQIKPSTAADRNVGIDDVSTAENNVHAGAKYLRFLADRYFSDAGVDDLNRWLLSLAAYNAGPAKVARMRREAESGGYDPDVWFDNVEVIAARRIGRETVTYVSNIFKYYVGYQIISERRDIRTARHGDTLTGCMAGATDQ